MGNGDLLHQGQAQARARLPWRPPESFEHLRAVFGQRPRLARMVSA
jgi:hypothetical protein